MMDSLYTGKEADYPSDDPSESVRNMLECFNDIQELISPDIVGDTLPMFTDWLIENVYLVVITEPSDDDAYAIFEAMNDRGLSLSQTDMLKSHLLAQVVGDDEKKRLNELWKARINQLQQLGKDEDAAAIKLWLRARYAMTTRTEQGPQDYEQIGTEYHRLVRNNSILLRLSQDGTKMIPGKFIELVENDFLLYSGWYANFVEASRNYRPILEAIYCNALSNFTLQYPMMLAAIETNDNEDVAWRKARTIATYIDILIARRIWSGRGADYNSMQYFIFSALKEMRGRDVK
jgi:hypothetical protein